MDFNMTTTNTDDIHAFGDISRATLDGSDIVNYQKITKQ